MAPVDFADPVEQLLTGTRGEPLDEFVRAMHGVTCSLFLVWHGVATQHAEWAARFADPTSGPGFLATRPGRTLPNGQQQTQVLVVRPAAFYKFTPTVDDLRDVLLAQHFCQVDAAFDLYVGLLAAALVDPASPPERRLASGAVVATVRRILGDDIRGLYANLAARGVDPHEPDEVIVTFERYRDERNLFMHAGGIAHQQFRSRMGAASPPIGARLTVDLAHVHDFMIFVRQRVEALEHARRRGAGTE